MQANPHSHIGMFDSGIGGLTVMKHLIQTMPHERVIYFGDTARLPYGGKSQETIIRYSIENTIFLLEKNIKLLVIPCNTASAFALEKLRKIFSLPIVGVIEPGAEKAVSVTKNQRIGVLGTKGTIQSGAYQKEILRLMPQATVFPIACPLFVHIVEEGFSNHEAARLIVREYLAPLKNQEIDTLLLGCTHYPILRHLIEEEMGPEVQLIDSASTCTEKVRLILQESNTEATQKITSDHQYFVSDDPQKFKHQAEKLFGFPIDIVTQNHA